MKSKQVTFLPVSRADMEERGWKELDIIIVSGDAYIDHPAFAAALLGRFLEGHGFKVGIIAQPDWRDTADFMRLGRPRLFFAVSAGNLDSMVNHYTADKKRRKEDAYSSGGKAGLRPDRPTIVYTNRLQQAFPGVPVVIGGIEASLRRLAHYDYWDDAVRRSMLLDSKADLLVYGMGEYALLEIANRLEKGDSIKEMRDIRGTVCAVSEKPPEPCVELPSFEAVKADKKAFAEAARLTYLESNPYNARPLSQQHGNRWVVQNPPRLPLSTAELDAIYERPFTRRAHPMYDEAGGVPALKTVQFSVVSHRGCFGGCFFCSLALHQGRFIQSRSIESLTREVESLTRHPDFRGTITDVGGPTANMYGLGGKDSGICRKCRRLSCLVPEICKNLNTDHRAAVEMLDRLSRIPGVKHLFVASGIRHDLILADPGLRYLENLCRSHISGQLKIAPEHVAPGVTRLMNKPGNQVFMRFLEEYRRLNRKLKKDQHLVTYFIAAHQGSGISEMVELAEFVRDQLRYHPEQAQNFTPTPMTVSTCMYYTGINPLTGENVYVPRSDKERRLQRALLQYRDPANRELVKEALEKCGRGDLIGRGPRALVREEREAGVKREIGVRRKHNGLGEEKRRPKRTK